MVKAIHATIFLLQSLFMQERNKELLQTFCSMVDHGKFKGHTVAVTLRDNGYTVHEAAKTMKSLGFSVDLKTPTEEGDYVLCTSLHPEGTRKVDPRYVGGPTADISFLIPVHFPGD